MNPFEYCITCKYTSFTEEDYSVCENPRSEFCDNIISIDQKCNVYESHYQKINQLGEKILSRLKKKGVIV